jgi:methionine-rich copper-binding protein CopC
MKPRFVIVGVLAIAALFLAVQTVFAHSRPVLLQPAPGAVLDTAPAQVRGWFTSELRRDPNWSFLKVTDAQGTRVDTGETTLSSDRKQMTVALRTGLGAGRYLVAWRTFDDADGEIFGDCYVFFVGQAAADASVAGNGRLDGGSACERIEFSASNGTPVPGTTPTAAGEDDHADDDHAESDSTSGLPVWALILGVAGGVVVGLVGSRFVSNSR